MLLGAVAAGQCDVEVRIRSEGERRCQREAPIRVVDDRARRQDRIRDHGAGIVVDSEPVVRGVGGLTPRRELHLNGGHARETGTDQRLDERLRSGHGAGAGSADARVHHQMRRQPEGRDEHQRNGYEGQSAGDTPPAEASVTGGRRLAGVLREDGSLFALGARLQTIRLSLRRGHRSTPGAVSGQLTTGCPFRLRDLGRAALVAMLGRVSGEPPMARIIARSAGDRHRGAQGGGAGEMRRLSHP